VYAHIHNLRRKLERNLGVSDRIVTIRGIGYKWVAE
jgi:DNA-binding response OmpR family regulator